MITSARLLARRSAEHSGRFILTNVSPARMFFVIQAAFQRPKLILASLTGLESEISPPSPTRGMSKDDPGRRLFPCTKIACNEFEESVIAGHIRVPKLIPWNHLILQITDPNGLVRSHLRAGAFGGA